MLKFKWCILFSLWAAFSSAEDVKCKDEFIETPAFLQTNPRLSQQNTRLKNKVQTSSHRWMSFEEAQSFIQSEGIRTSAEFLEWKRAGKRPEDFPSAPERTYKEEWTSWGDFLGTGNIALSRKKEFMSFEEAKTFIRSEGIQTSIEFEEWKRAGKRPEDFPSNPQQTYKEEWTGWGDFLGTGNISNRKKEFMSFEEAKTFIRSEGIQTSAEFQEWRKSGERPEDFPSNPNIIYKEEWTGWGDFLGTRSISTSKRKFMSFEEAKTFIRSEGIQTNTEFKAWSRSGKRPEDFPSAPERTYKKEWTGWSDFLGTGNIALSRKKEFMSFEEAQAFIQSEGIQTSVEFKAWSRSGKRPKKFPSSPNKFYKKEWTGWGDFLGTGSISTRQKEFMSFEEAKTFIRSEGIQSSVEFNKWRKSGERPEDFPSNPNIIYKKEWTGWGDFLGTRSISTSKRKFMSFEEAKTFIRSEGIQTSTEFKAWSRSGKRPEDFPSAPERTYKEEWTGWSDFLGTGNIALSRKKEFMSFEEAKTFIQNKGFTSQRQFRQWSKDGKRPEDFPSAPERIYKDKWTGWSNFLGTGNISSKRQEWMSKAWKKSGKRSENFPNSSERTNKDKWTSGGLGTGNMAPSRKKEFMSFEEAEIFIRNEGIQTRREFEAWKRSGKRPEDFPSVPERTYKEEWTGWDNFLGTGNISTREEAMSFEEAKKYVQTLGFDQPRDFIEWLRSSDRPIHFPPNPHQFYSEWISVKDFLSAEKYISYKEAKTFAQSLEITNSRDFLELMKDEPDIFPEDFPPNPNLFYSKKGDWIDWNDFLGITDQIYNKINEQRAVSNREGFQNEEMEEDNFVDGIDV